MDQPNPDGRATATLSAPQGYSHAEGTTFTRDNTHKLRAVRHIAKQHKLTLQHQMKRVQKKKEQEIKMPQGQEMCSEKMFMDKFFAWLREWDLDKYLAYCESDCDRPDDWMIWDYWNTEDSSFLDWGPATTMTSFHGTSWYTLGRILRGGKIEESCGASLGYSPNNGGVYSTPSLTHAAEYAIPQCVFNDSVYHRVVLEIVISVNASLKLGKKHRSREEWVTPSGFVKIVGVWCQPNTIVKISKDPLDVEPHLPYFDEDLEFEA